MSESIHPALDGRVVAVLRTQHANQLYPVADALVAGGVRSLEVTLTTDGAFEGIDRLRSRFDPEVSVGAGTVLDGEAADTAIKAGASFIVSPGFVPEVVDRARSDGILALPGVLTPTEAMSALAAGTDTVKLFPAGAHGPGYLRDLLAPLPRLRVVPTGGIGIEDAPHYLAAGAVAVGLGGALLGDAAEGGSLASLEARARRLMELVGARGGDRIGVER